MKPNQYRNEYIETPFWLAIYRTIWCAVVATAIIAACGWADRHSHGVPPEHQEVGKP